MPRFCHPCSAKDIVVLSGLGVLCFPLWLSLIPHLEQGREEARIVQAFIQVRRLQNEIASSTNAAGEELLSDGPAIEGANVVTGLSELDPWGQPYQLVTRRDGRPRIVRVFSFGPNALPASEGLNPDDITSDMSVRPTKKFEDLRLRQWLVAFGVAGAAWFVACCLYFATASRKSERLSWNEGKLTGEKG